VFPNCEQVLIVFADILPGPVTWYAMSYTCGPSDGRLAAFPFTGPRFNPSILQHGSHYPEFDTSLLGSLWSPAHSSPWAIDCISHGERAEGAFLTDQQLSALNSIPKIGPLQQSKPFRLI
jgi:hypothetical protein